MHKSVISEYPRRTISVDDTLHCPLIKFGTCPRTKISKFSLIVTNLNLEFSTSALLSQSMRKLFFSGAQYNTPAKKKLRTMLYTVSVAQMISSLKRNLETGETCNSAFCLICTRRTVYTSTQPPPPNILLKRPQFFISDHSALAHLLEKRLAVQTSPFVSCDKLPKQIWLQFDKLFTQPCPHPLLIPHLFLSGNAQTKNRDVFHCSQGCRASRLHNNCQCGLESHFFLVRRFCSKCPSCQMCNVTHRTTSMFCRRSISPTVIVQENNRKLDAV